MQHAHTYGDGPVLITGICGAFGKMVAKRLSKTMDVIGVDLRSWKHKPKTVELYALDLRHNSTYDFLCRKRPAAVVHLGVMRNPLKYPEEGKTCSFNLDVTNRILKLVEEVGVKKLVFLSSSNLYGPSARTSGFLSEEVPLHGADRSPEIRDLVMLDVMVQSFLWKHPHAETVILRPVHLVGAGLNNAPSRYFGLHKVPTLIGYDPVIQIVDAEDATRSVELALRPQVRGIFNVIGLEQAPLSRVIRACGKPSVPLPEFVLRMFLNQIFQRRFAAFPSGELAHLKYTCLADGSYAKQELGYEPRIPLQKTLQGFLNKPTM